VVNRVTNPEIERLVELLRALPPAPAAWVQAAQELPLFRGELDRIVARAEADAEFRQALIDDLEAALAAEGYVAGPAALEAIRRRLAY
jgi:regulator of protease activity HflC (stomatin/prohibitin superfamily)